MGEKAVRWQALTKGLNKVAGYACLIYNDDVTAQW
jgi:hypothetical protein